MPRTKKKTESAGWLEDVREDLSNLLLTLEEIVKSEKVPQDKFQGELQKAVAVAVNRVDLEWAHRLDLERLRYENRIALLELELDLLKGRTRSYETERDT